MLSSAQTEQCDYLRRVICKPVYVCIALCNIRCKKCPVPDLISPVIVVWTVLVNSVQERLVYKFQALQTSVPFSSKRIGCDARLLLGSSTERRSRTRVCSIRANTDVRPG